MLVDGDVEWESEYAAGPGVEGGFLRTNKRGAKEWRTLRAIVKITHAPDDAVAMLRGEARCAWVGAPMFSALCLAKAGDLMRREGRIDAAASAYSEALRYAGRRSHDPAKNELCGRLCRVLAEALIGNSEPNAAQEVVDQGLSAGHTHHLAALGGRMAAMAGDFDSATLLFRNGVEAASPEALDLLVSLRVLRCQRSQIFDDLVVAQEALRTRGDTNGTFERSISLAISRSENWGHDQGHEGLQL